MESKIHYATRQTVLNFYSTLTNKYECAMDQELTSHALGGLAAAGECCCICGGRTWNDVMATILRFKRMTLYRKPKIRQSKNKLAKFHRHPIWSDGALGFFEDGCPSNKKNKMSSDIGSVPDQTRYMFKRTRSLSNASLRSSLSQ